MAAILTKHDWPAVLEALTDYRDHLRENEPSAVQSIQALNDVMHELPPETEDNHD